MTDPTRPGPARHRLPIPAATDGVDVDAVAETVRRCPGVSGLDGGRFGEVATYLPGRRVAGVVATADRVTVQVRSRWGIPAAGLAAQIRAALAPVTGRPVNVVIADIDDPDTAAGRVPAASQSGCEI
ncbi:MAG: hypothetical protein ACR2FU_25070 [Streptosporangiaceae bacterium]